MKRDTFFRKKQMEKQKQIQKEEPQTPKQKIVQSIQKDEFLQCYVCLEEFNSQDRLPMFTCLNCLDIVCQRCLNDKQRAYQKKMQINKCNKCALEIEVDLIKKCLPLVNFISLYQKIKIKEKQYRRGIQYLQDQLTNAMKKINQCETNHLKQLQMYKKQSELKSQIIKKKQKQIQNIKKQLQWIYAKDSSLKINSPIYFQNQAEKEMQKVMQMKNQQEKQKDNKKQNSKLSVKNISNKKKKKVQPLEPEINEDYFQKIIQKLKKTFPDVFTQIKKQQVKEIQVGDQFNFIAIFQQNKISDPMRYLKHIDLKYLNLLSLNGNNISDKGFVVLTQMDLPHLNLLSLSNNSLKDIPGISRFKQLQTLNLLDSQTNSQGQTFSFPNKLSEVAAKQLVQEKWQYLQQLAINFVDFKPRQMKNAAKQPHKYQNKNAWQIIIQNCFECFPSLQKMQVGHKKLLFLSQETFKQLQRVSQQSSQHPKILLW